MVMFRSALIVPVPAAEPAVAEHRARHDRYAKCGVPAHITVLSPFLPAELLTAEARSALRDLARSWPAVDVVLDEVRWFGHEVVWLAPVPAGPLVDLIRAVQVLFPAVRPYEGRFDGDPVPHLTVAHEAPYGVLQAVGEAVRPSLPVAARCVEMHLGALVGEEGVWTVLDVFPFAPAEAEARSVPAVEP